MTDVAISNFRLLLCGESCAAAVTDLAAALTCFEQLRGPCLDGAMAFQASVPAPFPACSRATLGQRKKKMAALPSPTAVFDVSLFEGAYATARMPFVHEVVYHKFDSGLRAEGACAISNLLLRPVKAPLCQPTASGEPSLALTLSEDGSGVIEHRADATSATAVTHAGLQLISTAPSCVFETAAANPRLTLNVTVPFDQSEPPEETTEPATDAAGAVFRPAPLAVFAGFLSGMAALIF